MTQITFLRTALSACFLWVTALVCLAQQNQKVVFPTISGYTNSAGSYITAAADGGYLLLGNVDQEQAGNADQPRAIRVGANLSTTWDQVYLPPTPTQGVRAQPNAPALEATDGGWWISVNDDSSAVNLIRTDAAGNQLYTKNYNQNDDLYIQTLLPDGKVLAVHDYTDVFVVHLDPSTGDIAYSNIVAAVNDNFFSATLLSNNDLLFASYSFQTQKTTLIRTNPLGIVQWQSTPIQGQQVGNYFALPGGGFARWELVTAPGTYRIRTFDDAGAVVSTTQNFNVQMIITSVRSAGQTDGSYLVSGQTVTQRGAIARLATDGTIIWQAEQPEDAQPNISNIRQSVPTADGFAAGVGTAAVPGGLQQMAMLRISANTGVFINNLTGKVALDADNNCSVGTGDWPLKNTYVTATDGIQTFGVHTNNDGEYALQLPPGTFTLNVDPHNPFHYLCPTAPVTVQFAPQSNGNATLDLPVQSPDPIHRITGKVTLDQNDNCVADPTDLNAEQWKVELRYGNFEFHTVTDADGEYEFIMPEGDYEVVLNPFNNNYGICGPANRQVSVSGATPQTVTEDFVGFVASDCGLLVTSLGITRIRPCTIADIALNYRNDGAVIIENAMATVHLDPSLEFVFAVGGTHVGNTVTFNLGDIPPTGASEASERVLIRVIPNCSLQADQQVCLAAQVTAEGLCGGSQGNQGPLLTASGECRNDSTIFTVTNIGGAPNASGLEFVIVEDIIILRSGTVPVLAPGQSTEIGAQPTDPNSTVTFEGEQDPSAPGDTTYTAMLTNCISQGNPMGGNPSGFGGDPGLFSSQICVQVFNSYDPNDKQAFPLGYGPTHAVAMGTPLDYTIRFQNTGNDTAFLVVLRDTLSQWFDKGSIRVLGASHNYELAQINDSIMHITFANIQLPDSTTNPEGSQGYFKFRIYPNNEVKTGTVVTNKAAIYFDFNPPIITNEVVRTYGNFVSSTDEPTADMPQLQVVVTPNPFVDHARLILPEDAPAGRYQAEAYDATGRFLFQTAFDGRQCRIESHQIPAGLLIWKVTRDGQPVASGRFIRVE
jgi:hypothetical protein